MSADHHFTNAREAVQAMRDAGAAFTIRDRADSLPSGFTYEVSAGGDIQRCRAILRAVKERPAVFWLAFVSEVRAVAAEAADGPSR